MAKDEEMTVKDMAVTKHLSRVPCCPPENGSSFTSAPSHGFHVDTAAFPTDGRMGDFGPKSDPRLIPILMEWLCKRKELPQIADLRNTLSKTDWSFERFSHRVQKGTAWSKDFQSGTKDLRLVERLSSQVQRIDARLKDFPSGTIRGTAWPKDSPVRYKKVLVVEDFPVG